MKKRLIVIALIVTMLLSAIALVGCNPNADDNNDNQGQNGENNGMPSMLDFAIENIDWLCVSIMWYATNKCPEGWFSKPYGENILGSFEGPVASAVILDKEYEVIDEELNARILEAFEVIAGGVINVSSIYIDKNIALPKTIAGYEEYEFPQKCLNDYTSMIDVTQAPKGMAKFLKDGLENMKAQGYDLWYLDNEKDYGGVVGGNEDIQIYYGYYDSEYSQEYIDEFNGKIASGEYLEGSYIRVEDGVKYVCIIAKRS